jgi:hypothetical protein
MGGFDAKFNLVMIGIYGLRWEAEGAGIAPLQRDLRCLLCCHRIYPDRFMPKSKP